MAKTISVRVDFLVLIFLVITSGLLLFGDVFTTTTRSLSSGSPTQPACSNSLEGERGQIIESYLRNLIVEPPAGSGVPFGIPALENPFPTAENITVANLESTFPPQSVVAQAIEGNVSLIALADSGGLEAIPVGSDNESDASVALMAAAGTASAEALASAKSFQSKVDDIIGSFFDSTNALADHDSYIIIRRMLQNAILQSRRRFVVQSALGDEGVGSKKSPRARTKCFQFVRDDQKPRDAISRIPCIPWDSDRLHTVALGRYGVLSQYHHIDPPTTETLVGKVKWEVQTGREPLRIGVAMSGQMRTYRGCYKSIVDNVLKTNEALLFIASYPDVGDKRFGVRVLERDDEVPAGEVAKMFSPYLAAMYTADLPTVTRRLNGEFPTLMTTSQHSWMVYQLFMMDLAHTILLRHNLGTQWTDGTYRPFVINSKNPSDGFHATPWKSFDIVVRIRPDLYILGPMWIRSLTPTQAVFNFSCGNHVFSKIFNSNELLRTPHHPYYRWVLDPISDHTAIGFTAQVTSFFELYKDARAMTPAQQEKDIFFFGNTVERMWTQHTERKKLTAVEVFGWHVMLRNPSKFLNSSYMMASSKRRTWLMMKIFAVTDPTAVECPPIDGKMWTLPPKPGRKK